MNPFSLSIWSLIGAMLAQSIVSGLAIELFLRKEAAAGQRRSWLAVAIGSTLLALLHGYTLELAVRTGLYDLRQALLAGLSASLFALGIYGIRRQTA